MKKQPLMFTISTIYLNSLMASEIIFMCLMKTTHLFTCLLVYWQVLMVCFSLYRPWRWRFRDAGTAGLLILGKQQGESNSRRSGFVFLRPSHDDFSLGFSPLWHIDTVPAGRGGWQPPLIHSVWAYACNHFQYGRASWSQLKCYWPFWTQREGERKDGQICLCLRGDE